MAQTHKKAIRVRNPAKHALFMRAGTGHVEILVDTRPKTTAKRKGKNDRKEARVALRKGEW